VLDDVITLFSVTLKKCADVIDNRSVAGNFMYGLKIGPHLLSCKVLSHMYCLRNRDILEDKHPGIVIIKIPVFRANKIEGRIGSLNVAIDISRDSTLFEHATHVGLPYGPVCVVKNILRPWDHVVFICRNNCYGRSRCKYGRCRSPGITTSITCHDVWNRGSSEVQRNRTNESTK